MANKYTTPWMTGDSPIEVATGCYYDKKKAYCCCNKLHDTWSSLHIKILHTYIHTGASFVGSCTGGPAPTPPWTPSPPFRCTWWTAPTPGRTARNPSSTCMTASLWFQCVRSRAILIFGAVIGWTSVENASRLTNNNLFSLTYLGDKKPQQAARFQTRYLTLN